jgi:predicted nucleic acid-binding protein
VAANDRTQGYCADANILLRAVFGRQVLHLLETYEDKARFYAPDVSFQDALKYIPLISKQRGFDAELSLSFLHEISGTVEQVDRSLYKHYEPIARERIDRRDPDDWPVVAVALLLRLPIWTEDQDFFGSGMATWTTDRVEVYLREP